MNAERSNSGGSPAAVASLGPRSGAWRYDAAFVLLSLSVVLLVFGRASLGLDLLAPLDIPGKLCRHFQWLEPGAGAIPQNHWVADIFDHELPRQYSVWRAFHGGEFPWWDPYTDSGRPLAAEAHISGTDPVRIALYWLLPFEPAYNWSKIISSLLFGAGAYLLLRSRGYPGWINIGCALAYQLASNHFLYLTPLCVTSSFAYYGLLWWCWGRLTEGWRWGFFVAAVLLCACILLAGNQQTHAYLAVFAGCFLVGYGFRNRALWKRLAAGVGGSLAAGALIALPVLIAQIEVFLLCQRPAAPPAPLAWLTGLANPAALFPWLMGTFRTPDAGKVFGQYGVGFSLYPGSVILILAIGGAVSLLQGRKPSGLCRTAVFLAAAYEIICLTPLLNSFYLRSSDLAVLGLTVLSAETLAFLADGEAAPRARKVMLTLSAVCLGLFIFANALALLVLPRIEGKLEQFVLSRDDRNAVVPTLPEFRRFQVANLKREISWRNPETTAAALSVVVLLLWLLRKQTGAGRVPFIRGAQAMLVLNLVPLVLFAHRFVPSQPIELWHKLREADSPQTRLASRLGLQYRYKEVEAQLTSGKRSGSLGHLYGTYPGATAHFYGVHHTIGYSSFQLPEVAEEIHALGLNLADSDMAENSSGSESGDLAPPGSGTSRFQWSTPNVRAVRVVRETLNRVTIEVAAGLPGTLVRTDRYYPGWGIVEPAAVKGSRLGQYLFAVEVPAEETRITFAYVPRFLAVTLPLSLLTVGGCVGGMVWGMVRRKRV